MGLRCVGLQAQETRGVTSGAGCERQRQGITHRKQYIVQGTASERCRSDTHITLCTVPQ
jgi:hypothetical protein